MHESLQGQLTLVEDTFLLSISQGPAALAAFERSWTSLQSTFSNALDQGHVDEDTMSQAYQVASRIEILAGHFLQLHEETEAVIKSLQTLKLDEQMAPSSHDSVSTFGKSSRSNGPYTHTLPPYNQPAYAWLLVNLHNPYPSKEIRVAIAQETGTSLKDIDNWFINVRKRIGWNKLRLKHYENKRGKIVDAATRFFKEVPQTLPDGPYAADTSAIDSTANHDSEFKSIESRARDLYSDNLFETSLATKLDGAGSNSTPMKARVPGEEKHCRQGAKYRKGKDLQRLSAYPSPERSPERSPEPSPERSPEPLAASLPIPNATPTISRKRRNCDRDSPELDVEDRCDEPQKRTRLDSYQISRDLAVASLPSPAASLSDITRDGSATPSDQDPSEDDCIILPTPPTPAAPSGKRKRRLSDAGDDDPPKRPHNALAVPRLQTVSDPLPLANPIPSEWYKTMFGQAISDNIPGPVSVESLDDTQVEVGLYNYNVSPDTLQPFLLANSSLGLYPAAPSLPSTTNSERLSLDKYEAPDPSFDFLFEPFLDVPQASTDLSSLFDIPSYYPSALFPFENMLPIQQPQEEVLCDPLPFLQLPTSPWDFQGNGDSFSTTAPSAGPVFSVPPQIDPTQNEKEAKLKQIEVLRAQLQDLESAL